MLQRISSPAASARTTRRERAPFAIELDYQGPPWPSGRPWWSKQEANAVETTPLALKPSTPSNAPPSGSRLPPHDQTIQPYVHPTARPLLAAMRLVDLRSKYPWGARCNATPRPVFPRGASRTKAGIPRPQEEHLLVKPQLSPLSASSSPKAPQSWKQQSSIARLSLASRSTQRRH